MLQIIVPAWQTKTVRLAFGKPISAAEQADAPRGTIHRLVLAESRRLKKLDES